MPLLIPVLLSVYVVVPCLFILSAIPLLILLSIRICKRLSRKWSHYRESRSERRWLKRQLEAVELEREQMSRYR